MVALNKNTGNVVWKCAVPGGDPPGYASIIIVQAAGRKQYVQFLEKGVVGVDAKTGQFLWRYAEPSKGPANIPTPVAGNGYVYAGGARIGGGLARLNATHDGIAAEEVYFSRLGGIMTNSVTIARAGNLAIVTTQAAMSSGCNIRARASCDGGSSRLSTIGVLTSPG